MASGTHPLSEDSQVTLLLCSPLLASKTKGVAPLSPGEFNELTRQLEREGRPLAALREDKSAAEILARLNGTVDVEQVTALLGRGFLLSLALEKWSSAGLWVMTRSDPAYPARFNGRLKHQAPPLLHGVGDSALLAGGGLAIVGSRDVDEAGSEFTRRVAEACAREGIAVVSGGARGVDQISMLAALEAGGRVVGVLADSLARSAVSARARDAIQEGRLTLVSAFDPEAGFNVGNAMARNKQIYSLADYGVVVSSGYNEGGTWSGAVEQLERLRCVPVFVREGETAPDGNRKLLGRGAISFPAEPWTPSLTDSLQRSSEGFHAPAETGDLFAAAGLRETPKR